MYPSYIVGKSSTIRGLRGIEIYERAEIHTSEEDVNKLIKLLQAAPGILEALKAVKEWAIEAEEGSEYKARILKPQAWEKVRVALAAAEGIA